MDKKIRAFIRRYFLVIWITAVCLTLSYMVVMAAYPTRQNKAKKVVSLQAQSEIQFSSNYLEESILYKTAVINDGDPITVDIRNFSKNNSTKWYLSDISFTLSAELTDSSGSSITNDSLIGNGAVRVYSVTVDAQEQETETLLFELTGAAPSDSAVQTLVHSASKSTVQSYRIYFPSTSTKVCLKLNATPANTHSDLRMIGAVLAVSDKSSIQSDGWTGSFNDPISKSPAEYDAFNYIITGHGDSSAATIKWNSNVIALNKMYFSNTFNKAVSSAADLGDGWKQLTFSISDDSNNGQYAFQVFKSGAGFDTFISGLSDEQDEWAELESCIVFDDGIDDGI